MASSSNFNNYFNDFGINDLNIDDNDLVLDDHELLSDSETSSEEELLEIAEEIDTANTNKYLEFNYNIPRVHQPTV